MDLPAFSVPATLSMSNGLRARLFAASVNCLPLSASAAGIRRSSHTILPHIVVALSSPASRRPVKTFTAASGFTLSPWRRRLLICGRHILIKFG